MKSVEEVDNREKVGEDDECWAEWFRKKIARVRGWSARGKNE